MALLTATTLATPLSVANMNNSSTGNDHISTVETTISNTTLDLEDMKKKWEDFINLIYGRPEDRVTTLNVDVVFHPDVEPGLVYVAAVVFGGLGIVGNAWLLCMSIQADLRGFSYCTYLFCASITDSISLVYVYMNALLQVRRKHMYILFSTLPSCIATTLTSQTASSMSPWIMVVFAVDRFVAVVFPLKRRVFCTVRNARSICGALFVMCLIQGVPSATKVRVIRFLGRDTCAEMPNDGMSTWLTVSIFLNTALPCLCLFYLNIHTLVAIKRAMAQRQRMTGAAEQQRGTDRQPARGTGRQQASGNCGEAEAHAMQREMMKMTKALLTLPCFTFIALTPYAITTCVLMTQLSISPKTHTETEPEPVMQFFLNAEVYCRLFYSSSFACSFYLLVITSTSYRQIARNMVSRCTAVP